MFITREARQGPGRFLQWKMRLFLVGAVIFAVGIGLKRDEVVLASIPVLAVALVLRLLEARAEHPPYQGDDFAEEEAEAEEPERRR